MKKNIIVLFALAFCFYSTTLLSQVTTRDVVVSFANTTTPFNFTTYQIYIRDRFGVTVTPKETLKCIPNTYLWTLTGTLSGIIATVDYISTRPNGGSQNGGTGSHDLISSSNSLAPPPPPCISRDSLDAYSATSCETRLGASLELPPVLIAVIDDGIGKTFVNGRSTVNTATFFQPYLWSNPSKTALGTIGYNFINKTTSPYNDNARHGSAVTSRIVDMLRKANVENVRIMVLQALEPSATPATVGSTGNIWQLCQALDFAYCNNANIINMSVGGLLGKINLNPESPRAETAGTSVFEVLFEYMRKTKGTIIVAAAGNDGKNVTIPRADGQRYCTASYQSGNLIEVAANANCSDALATFSNFGSPNVHLTAPGENLYCAVPLSTTDPRGVALMKGTSLAAPHVTAAAAILAASRPYGTEIYYPYIYKSLLEGVTPVASLRDVVSSSGRLNMCSALTVFNRNYPVIRMAAPTTSNTEGGTKSTINTLNISPNPVNSEVTVHVNSLQDEQTIVVIRDILGREMLQQACAIYQGQNALSIDASKLNKGIYFINIRIGEQNLTQKMIKN